MNFLKMWNWRLIVKNTLIYIAGMTIMIFMIILGSAITVLDTLPMQDTIKTHQQKPWDK